VFTARDGRRISLGVVQQHQFVVLAKLLGREDWLIDARYCDPDKRREHAAAMLNEVGSELAKRDAADWEQHMSAAGIPCGMVREVGEAVSLPHLAARNTVLPITIPGLPQRQEVHVINAGFSMSLDGPGVSDPPPRLGEHNDTILHWLGYDAAAIAALALQAST
jgi:crotonobetainyl-CoA:carnitine CoA-transferase CaiB-like acyl-CoA transferase